MNLLSIKPCMALSRSLINASIPFIPSLLEWKVYTDWSLHSESFVEYLTIYCWRQMLASALGEQTKCNSFWHLIIHDFVTEIRPRNQMLWRHKDVLATTWAPRWSTKHKKNGARTMRVGFKNTPEWCKEYVWRNIICRLTGQEKVCCIQGTKRNWIWLE